MSEEATLVVQLPKLLEKQLRAHYDEMIATVIDGVTLYDKRAVTRWLKQYER